MNLAKIVCTIKIARRFINHIKLWIALANFVYITIVARRFTKI